MNQSSPTAISSAEDPALKAQDNGFGIAALVCGIIGLTTPIFAILGIVFGIIGRRTGLGIAGLICGFIGLVSSSLLFVMLILLFIA